MRRGNRVFVEDLAVGGVAAVEFVAVPGGDADRAVIDIFARDISAPGDHIGLADPVDAAAFGHRLAERDHPCAAGDAVTGIDLAAARAIGERQTAAGKRDQAQPRPYFGKPPMTTHPLVPSPHCDDARLPRTYKPALNRDGRPVGWVNNWFRSEFGFCTATGAAPWRGWGAGASPGAAPRPFDLCFYVIGRIPVGRVAERLKAPVLKTGSGATHSWVRIPPLPPFRVLAHGSR